jgi:hypothetical protein
MTNTQLAQSLRRRYSECLDVLAREGEVNLDVPESWNGMSCVEISLDTVVVRGYGRTPNEAAEGAISKAACFCSANKA